MTLAGLQALAAGLFDLAVKELRETKSLTLKVHVIAADDSVDVFVIDPAMIDDSAGKEKAGARIRACVREKNAQAVIVVSDMWVGSTTDKAAARRIQEERLNVVEAERAGLLKKRECLVLNLEAPGPYLESTKQFYRRNAHGAVILEEKETEDPQTYRSGIGRFSGFFLQEQATGRPS